MIPFVGGRGSRILVPKSNDKKSEDGNPKAESETVVALTDETDRPSNARLIIMKRLNEPRCDIFAIIPIPYLMVIRGFYILHGEKM